MSFAKVQIHVDMDKASRVIFSTLLPEVVGVDGTVYTYVFLLQAQSKIVPRHSTHFPFP